MAETGDQIALFDLLNRLAGVDTSGRPIEGITARLPLLRWCTHVANEANGGGRTVRLAKNGGSPRNVPVEALQNARMGCRAGVPDILCFVPNQQLVNNKPVGYYFGCAIEMKGARGVLRPEQSDWLYTLDRIGWCAIVECEWTRAARFLIHWVGGDPDEVIGL